jgi:DNA-binding MarR family transcriptional regulator
MVHDKITTPRPLPRASRFDSVQQEAYLNLWRTYDRLRSIEDSVFLQFDLTAQQYNTLRLLRGEHPLKLHTLVLAKRLVSKAPDITRLLDRLEERKFISRERPDDNRRVVKVGITPHGLKLLQKIDHEVLECNKKQLGHLDEQQLNQLVSLLRLARAPHEEPDSFWR